VGPAQGSRRAGPPWLDPAVEDPLDAEIQAAFDAGDPDEAVRQIEVWRQAWMGLLAPQVPDEARVGPSPAVVAAARRLDAARLFDLVHDPDVPEADRTVYRTRFTAGLRT